MPHTLVSLLQRAESGCLQEKVEKIKTKSINRTTSQIMIVLQNIESLALKKKRHANF